jgi:hypothetical protein
MLILQIALGIALGVLILAYLSQIIRWTLLSIFLLLFVTLGIVLSVVVDSDPEFMMAPVSSTLAYFSLGMSVFAFIGLLWEAYKDDRLVKQQKRDEEKRREMAMVSGSTASAEQRLLRLAKIERARQKSPKKDFFRGLASKRRKRGGNCEEVGLRYPMFHDDDFRG